MRDIVAKIEDNKIVIKKIRVRQTPKDIEEISLQLLEYGKVYKSNIKATSEETLNKVFLIQKIEKRDIKNLSDEEEQEDMDKELEAEENKVLDDVIIVYSDNGKIKYSYCNEEAAYKKIIKFRYKVLGLSLNKRKLKLKLVAYFINKHGLEIKNQKLYVDQVLGKECKLLETDHKMTKIEMLRNKTIHTFSFRMKDILQDVSEINGNMRMSIEVDGRIIDFRIGIKDSKMKNKRYYYSPMKPKYIKDFAVHFRRTTRGNLVLVKRLKEPIENTFKFRFMESKVVSGFLYAISKVLIRLRKKKINLFYEKFSSKVEEGAYDLFLLAKKSNQSKNYFIIDEHSEDYPKIKSVKNVVKKYSIKYYWLVFNSSNFISTEAPIHLNIIRSNNTALRRSTCDKKFIFLQHGITYMKCQGDGSTFAKNKEGEATYIIVGSEKEKDAVVDMLKLNEEQVLNTGLPIFSKIDFKHINENSDDIVTLMLTWKPYEEQLYSFEESTYYKNIVEICDMLTKYIDKEKIVIIPHPKVFDLLTSTDMKENVWQGKISEILEKTKMLITDYSSVCYNTFYQGGGVVFYQPDLELYETYNGPLVPTDDEYIGKRAFNMKELETISKECLQNGKVDLSKLRNKKFEENYSTINEFSDGKNIERIYEKLQELNLV